MNNTESMHHLFINNMGCASCVETIKSYLNAQLSISEMHINFPEKIITIKSNAYDLEIIRVLQDIGYEAESINEPHIDKENEFESSLFKKTLLSLLFACPLVFNMFYQFIPPLDVIHGYTINLILGLLTFMVLVYSGGNIYKSAYKAFKHHQANMDTLVAIGTGSAWLYSMIIILFNHLLKFTSTDLYFESAIVIIALINLGSLLENRAKSKATSAIKQLIDLQPKQAAVIIDNEEVIIPINQVKANQLIKVYPGEKIPVDGVIEQGESRIDESMLTGEPHAIKKTQGAKVYTGTVNTTGSFLFKATQVGDKTALAQIINLVQQAQNSKPNISKLADVIAHYFVPTVLIIAVITALCWFNFGYDIGMILTTTMAVLVIACPCALGLATPMATIAGIGKAAEAGILIKNGQSLQDLSRLSDIVFDKTGTITEGKPSITKSNSTKNFDKDYMLALAYSLEQHSEHPLAHAIVTLAKAEKIKPFNCQRFEVIEGKGVSAFIDDKQCLLGNRALLASYDIKITSLGAEVSQLEQQGNTLTLLAYNDEFIGYFALSDAIKSDARQVIDQLNQLNIISHLYSGDNEKTVELVAKELGFKQFKGNLLPQDKLTLINQLQTEGRVVAMVGDGINDAPALARADVGIAIGTGTDVAIESADVVIMKDKLSAIAENIIISRATMRNIKQNLVGAFAYNIIGIPIAAGILYPFTGLLLNPMIAGAAMAASSLTVVLNANRLRFLDPSKILKVR